MSVISSLAKFTNIEEPARRPRGAHSRPNGRRSVRAGCAMRRVPQPYVGALTPGVTATLRMRQYSGQDFSATLVTTSNSIAQDSRTALVELQADSADGKLWPGAYTEAHFHIPADTNALSIPASALMFGEHGMRVATVGGDQTVLNLTSATMSKSFPAWRTAIA
jgi:multidrug efflux pump subunit AcrA (membrane-fusion protein)